MTFVAKLEKLMKNKFLNLTALAGLPLAACFSSCSNSGDNSADKQILAAGATFPYPLYSKMFNKYDSIAGIQTNYQSVGSGGGVQQLLSKTVDFGASDAYLSDEEISKMPAPVVEFPTCIGADVISYNLPGNPQLKLNPELITAIFMGTITKWNDEKLKAENPSANLPDIDITLVHRSDGSGTTYIFTDYLSKVSPEWKEKVGMGKSVNWPVGVGGKGNEGVANVIKQTPGAIGYIELIYALQNQMQFADVKNASGNYITASLQSVSLCANGDIPADTRISITNSAVAQGYPISSFTWIIVYKEQKYGDRTKDKATNVLKELWWMIHDGQQYTTALNYAPLPPKATAAAEAILKSVTYGGQAIL
jgi:phosphate transport system substrate-binding protein